MTTKRDYNKDKIICECGVEILRTGKSRHILSDKHINGMSRRAIPEPVPTPISKPIMVSQETQTEPEPDYKQLFMDFQCKYDKLKQIILPDFEFCKHSEPPPKPPISVNVYKCNKYHILTFNENDELFDEKQLSIESKLTDIKASLRKNLKTQSGNNLDIGWIITQAQLDTIKKHIQSIGIMIFYK